MEWKFDAFRYRERTSVFTTFTSIQGISQAVVIQINVDDGIHDWPRGTAFDLGNVIVGQMLVSQRNRG